MKIYNILMLVCLSANLISLDAANALSGFFSLIQGNLRPLVWMPSLKNSALSLVSPKKILFFLQSAKNYTLTNYRNNKKKYWVGFSWYVINKVCSFIACNTSYSRSGDTVNMRVSGPKIGYEFLDMKAKTFMQWLEQKLFFIDIDIECDSSSIQERRLKPTIQGFPGWYLTKSVHIKGKAKNGKIIDFLFKGPLLDKKERERGVQDKGIAQIIQTAEEIIIQEGNLTFPDSKTSKIFFTKDTHINLSNGEISIVTRVDTAL